MKITNSRSIAVAAVCLTFGAFATVSSAKDEHPKTEHPAGEHPSGAAEHPGNAGEMEKMMTLMAPGPQHAALAAMTGHWKTEVTSYWMDPKNPAVSVGTTDCAMDLGGRVLRSTHTSEMMGMPFEGRNIDGYDNAKGTYWSFWLDSMGTGYMLSTGSASADGKTITYTGTTFDPMMGKEMTYKLVTTIIDANKHTFDMYTMDGGAGTKVMAITYTRM